MTTDQDGIFDTQVRICHDLTIGAVLYPVEDAPKNAHPVIVAEHHIGDIGKAACCYTCAHVGYDNMGESDEMFRCAIREYPNGDRHDVSMTDVCKEYEYNPNW